MLDSPEAPPPDRSIVLAADVPPEQLKDLMGSMVEVEGMNGVKVGFELGLGMELYKATEVIREADENLEVTYDHQKGGNDIPASYAGFTRAMKRGSVDTVILFPFTGPTVQELWTKSLQEEGIKVITGADMTHDDLVASEDGKSGGYIHPKAIRRMYSKAVDLGVRDFVVPGNSPEKVEKYRQLFDREIGIGKFTLWAPGFITQGGDLTETGLVAGPNFRAIVGGAIYHSDYPRQTAIELGQKVLNLT